jgi:hypothetical protein
MKHSMETTADGGRGFWIAWAVAFLGFPLGGTAAAVLVGAITTPLAGALGGALTGAVIGVAEWLVLRRRLPLTPAWIAATALGMGVGLALSIALLGTDTAGSALPLRGLITGAGIGAAQYVLLRGIISRAPVWVLVVALSWTVGWLITRAVGVDLAQHWSVFGSSGALLFQLLSGLTLAWLLQRRGVAPESQEARLAA